MGYLFLLLLVLGFLINFVCGIIILIKAFRLSVGWGLAVLFIPFAGLVFIIKNWEETKTPFLAGLAGSVLMVLGILGTSSSMPKPAETTVAVATPAASETGEPPVTYAAAAATPAPAPPYEPPRSAYQPTAIASTPPPEPAPATATQPAAPAPGDEWERKPMLEQVYVDREAKVFYPASCKKRPESASRMARSVAVMQGMTEAECK